MTKDKKAPKNPWDKQPGETNISFYFFTLYLHLGPHRTLANAEKMYREARKMPQSKTPGIPGSQFTKWSRYHSFVDRVGKYDVETQEYILAYGKELTEARIRETKEALFLSQEAGLAGSITIQDNNNILLKAVSKLIEDNPPESDADVAVYAKLINLLSSTTKNGTEATQKIVAQLPATLGEAFEQSSNVNVNVDGVKTYINVDVDALSSKDADPKF